MPEEDGEEGGDDLDQPTELQELTQGSAKAGTSPGRGSRTEEDDDLDFPEPVYAEQEDTDGFEFDVNQPIELPELTEEMKEEIRRAERSRGEVLVDAYKIKITVKDINTLKGLQWLNDEVINFYMQVSQVLVFEEPNLNFPT